jgi:hypothetical protein
MPLKTGIFFNNPGALMGNTYAGGLIRYVLLIFEFPPGPFRPDLISRLRLPENEVKISGQLFLNLSNLSSLK